MSAVNVPLSPLFDAIKIVTQNSAAFAQPQKLEHGATMQSSVDENGAACALFLYKDSQQIQSLLRVYSDGTIMKSDANHSGVFIKLTNSPFLNGCAARVIKLVSGESEDANGPTENDAAAASSTPAEDLAMAGGPVLTAESDEEPAAVLAGLTLETPEAPETPES